MHVLARQNAGKGCQVSHFAFLGLYDQYAEHLALRQLFFPCVLQGKIVLHFFRGSHAEWMRCIAKGKVNFSGKGMPATEVWKWCSMLMLIVD